MLEYDVRWGTLVDMLMLLLEVGVILGDRK
jgi:hypothetical protein